MHDAVKEVLSDIISVRLEIKLIIKSHGIIINENYNMTMLQAYGLLKNPDQVLYLSVSCN